MDMSKSSQPMLSKFLLNWCHPDPIPNNFIPDSIPPCVPAKPPIAANKHCTTVQSPKQLLMYLQHINISFYILYKISSILFYQLYNISLRLIIYILQYLQITDVLFSAYVRCPSKYSSAYLTISLVGFFLSFAECLYISRSQAIPYGLI